MKPIIPILLFLAAAVAGCQKQTDWLDARVNRSTIVPSRLSDYQSMLDADVMFQNYGYLARVSSDNYYVTEADFLSATTDLERSSCTWAQDVLGTRVPTEWTRMYLIIATANICLEGLEKLSAGDGTDIQRKQVKGTALFYRSMAYYNLLQHFCQPYDPSSAASLPGVPLRFSADVNERLGRGTIAQVYEEITGSLEKAIPLLPANVALKTQPSQNAARVQLARAYLATEQWAKAEVISGQVLADNPVLLDFKKLNSAASFSFPTFETGNPEVIHYAEGTAVSLMTSNKMICDPVLFNMYAGTDLRRTILYRQFNGMPIFKGQYTGRATPFAGIAYNEVYLIHAEACARQGKTTAAMQTLNQLVATRHSAQFSPLSAGSAQEALDKIVSERRKEMPYTGSTSWEDLRRLNRDPRYQRTLTRKIGTATYTLAPGSKRYTFPIPLLEVQLTGIEQNERP